MKEFLWVCEVFFSVILLLFTVLIQTLICDIDVLIFLFELFLQALDVRLERLFTFLVLAFQGQNLIICFRGLSVVVKAFLADDSRVVLKFLNRFLHFLDAFLRILDFGTHLNNTVIKFLVLAHDLVVENLFVLKLELT